jgi:hypothetical protein
MTKLYRLAVVLHRFPDDVLFTAVSDKAWDLRDLAYSLAAESNVVQLQVLDINHQHEASIPLKDVDWGTP